MLAILLQGYHAECVRPKASDKILRLDNLTTDGYIKRHKLIYQTESERSEKLTPLIANYRARIT